MKFGDFEISIIRESTFKLDGGAMFGVVPKALWANVASADAANRVELSCNLLFIQTPNGNVLIETGMGPRWSEKERARYDLKTLIDHNNVLESIGLSNTDVSAVVLSHLHFDHVGGACVDRDGKLSPTFPKAKYYTQKGELEFAYKANARAQASYREADFKTLLDNNMLIALEGDHEILPGIKVHVSGGHTSHHQIITFESNGNHGVYFGDIIPTQSHLPPPWVMGYDHYPLETCDIKSRWLATAANKNWLVVFDHEPGVPWGHVQAERSKFIWKPFARDSLAVV
ncbi:MAG: MBL fold metallo-hydrolase [Candidatus Obscuribacterales bacterium]|nr:MBL fold metallo-hydrolase [Candidatus Obscuribacterales bacterium]